MRLRRPTYAEVASTLSLALVLGTGGAYAASKLITGKDIAKNAVTSTHIKDGAVTAKDLNKAVVARLNTAGTPGPAGPKGATGAAGPAGTPGATGATGAKGDRGVSSWDTIPSGTTVTGQEYYLNTGTAMIWNVALPGNAPTPLTANNVNFANTAPAVTTDEDSSCTGTFRVPTAPPGKVCIYTASNSLGTGVTDAAAHVWETAEQTRRYFYVAYSGFTAGSSAFYTWAYTAP